MGKGVGAPRTNLCGLLHALLCSSNCEKSISLCFISIRQTRNKNITMHNLFWWKTTKKKHDCFRGVEEEETAKDEKKILTLHKDLTSFPKILQQFTCISELFTYYE